MKKVLITDSVHPLLPEQLQQMGFIVDYLPEINRPDVLASISAYAGLIINSKINCDKELLDSATNLQFICRLGSGMEVMDTMYAATKGIQCFNSAEGNSQAVAEHALGLLLGLLNHIPQANYEVKQGKWIREPNRGTQLAGKTVGLMGYGHTAQAFAKVLSGFEVSVLAYDKYKSGFSHNHVKEATLPELFTQADVFSIHLPLTVETTNLINYEFLNQFQKPIYLLNTARGKNVVTADLLQCIDEGKIIAAALDVLENEQINSLNAEEQKWFDRLTADNRIILTPHIAGWTYESKKHIAEVVVQKIRGFMQS